MRRRLILPVPLLLFLLAPLPAAPEHEPCVGITSRFFRQGLNFLVRGEIRNRCAYEVRDLRVTVEAMDGERKAVAEAPYPVSPSSLAPGGVAGFAGVVRATDDAATAAARVSWSHD
ncbi:MAG: hypothetical protein HYT86_01725 [candidate division NC10 bacterium]|nr:hypothetical protein [candidate division NC10 bacterium]